MDKSENGYDNLQKAMEKIKSIKIPQVDLSKMTTLSSLYTTPHFEIPEMPEFEPIPLAEHIERTEEYQARSLEMLESINTNTANLYTLVDLISKSNEKQDEMIGVITDILSIAKAKEKREAESLLKKAMTKINDTVETADSIVKLVGWASMIYNMTITMLPG